jgi:hypothetical protein
MIDQADLLRAMALKYYDLDGGEMFECTSREEYRELIREHGSAEAAWNAELEGHKLRRDHAEEIRSSYY